MKQKLLKTLAGAMVTFAFVMAFCLPANAQSKVEKLVIYENFGGVDAGTSVPGLQPAVWPAVHSDSAKQSGWYSTQQKLDNVNTTAYVPQFYSNGIFHIDSLRKYRTGGLTGLAITVDDATKTWSYPVTLRNGYKMPFTGATTVGFRLLGVAALPEFYSWQSYGPKIPDYLKNQTDEKGYLYFAKDPTVNGKVVRPILTIPGSDIDFLQGISKIEMLISGSRLNALNTLSVTIEELTQDGVTVGTKTLTYSATIEPRLITVPVNKDYCRIYIQAWGQAANANVTDFALLTSNTEVDTRTPYNWNAIAGTKPTDGTANAGITANPGMSLHMIKVYAKVDGGYTIKTDATVTGTKTGISYGDSATLTAPATNASSKKFMGWKIYGRPDLSEVANPLKIKVIDTMTIMPVYAGDMVEVPVVNENFTNWVQVGTTDATKNNGLIYTLDAPTGTFTGAVRVPLRYGFTSGGKDSVDITLNTCYVIPQYGLRVYNVPGWQNYPGYIAFMGPKGTKGYVSVGSLDGITKAEVDLSNIDIAGSPNRACAIKVNGTISRNKMLQTLYAQTVVIKNNPATSFALQVGPGNQAQYEYLSPETTTADIFTSNIAAAPIAMHNLKLYATVAIPSKNYYRLTATAVTGGYIAGTTPSSGNSTNQYMDGTRVTICAVPFLGYGFDGWVDGNGASLGTTATITITMDANKTVKALFAQNPTYIKLIANPKGSVTYSITPQKTSNDTLTYLAGVGVNLTATGNYGFKFNKWTNDGRDTVPSSSSVKTNVLGIIAAKMLKNNTKVISVTYDSITARQLIIAKSDTTLGKITFDHTPENITYSNDTLRAKFPKDEPIIFTAAPGYGYDFSKWTKGFSVANADTLKNPVTIAMSADKTIAANWVALARKRLEIGTGPNGTIRITDKHKDGTQEQQSLWPINYQVELTAKPASGYVLASVGTGVSAIFVNDSVVTVTMDKDTVRVVPEFVTVKSGVVLAVNENFQNSKLWPEPIGTVSNVPGAIDFLGLDASWDPKTYNNNLEGLLKILAPYRVWGSQSNDNSDGPGGTKTPKTTLVLKYQKNPLISKLRIGTSKDSVKVTVTNYAPCNNCLISKAVKEANISNKYLGHVTPGFVALKKLSITTRSAETNPAILANDTIGMMLIEGLAYVQKLEVGYVSGSTQFAPGVFYITDQTIKPMSTTGVFNASYGDLWPIGQVTRTDYSPYNNRYGWGASQEGMLMDQGMYVAEDGLPETKILITAGYKKTGTTGSQVYSYSDIYIHDLRIWGSPKVNTGINDLINSKDKTVDGCKFYMLGSTNMLKVDVDDQIKAVVIYNINGAAVKVVSRVDGNQVDLSSLKPGFYGAHAYSYSGKMYKGGFVKVN